MKVYIYIIISFIFIGNESFSQEKVSNYSNSSIFKKAPVLVALNTATIVSIGILKWDWGSHRFSLKNEGFFGANTANGGADKTGHLWTSYIFSNINMHFLKKSGVRNYKEYGILLAWVNMLVIELGDGTSKTYGFSFEDLLFNTLGSGISYLRAQNEFAKNLIDIRIEFTPSEFSFDGIIIFGFVIYFMYTIFPFLITSIGFWLICEFGILGIKLCCRKKSIIFTSGNIN